MIIANDTLTVETRGDGDMIDITDRLALLLQKHKLKAGQMLVFVPGSTASLTTIEFEPGLKRDFIPFGQGRLLLGTWQQVVLIDFDNRPRERNLVVQVSGE